MKKLSTIILLLITLQVNAADKGNKVSRKAIPAVGTVLVSQAFVKPEMEKLNKIAIDSLLARPVIHVPSLRKQTKRYRPASAPALQAKLNWVFAY